MTDDAREHGASRGIVAAAFAVAVAMIAQQLAGKAIRDAYFLSNFSSDVLPRVMTVASVGSLVSVLVVTRLYARFSPARLVPLFFLASAALYGVEWVLSADHPQAASALLYLHFTSIGAVAISGFWSVISERFDPHTAKRVVGRVAAGATLGGIVGGVLAWQAAGRLPIPVMLLVFVGVNVFCAVILALVGRAPSSVRPTRTRRVSPWAAFEETPYLVHLAALVVLTAVGTAGIDYVFKATAANFYEDNAALVSFFAIFYLGVGIVTFVLQTAFATRLLRWAGLGVAVATLPGAILLFGGVAFVLPGLLSLALLRGGAMAVESSSYRSGYELLYTPLAREKKRPTKTLIDVGGDKLGAALGGAIAVFLVGLAPDLATALLLALGLGCAATGVWLSRRLSRGYVEALEESLANGRIDMDAVPLQEAATRAAVERTVAALDRSSVLSDADLTRPDALSATIRPTPTLVVDRTSSVEPHPLPPDSIAKWIARLADRGRQDVAVDLLTRSAPAHTGALLDALLSRRTPLECRRRLAAILGRTATRRCAEGLVFALETEPAEIRFRVACALSDLKERVPGLTIDSQQIFRLAGRAVDRAHLEWFGPPEDETGELLGTGIQAGRTVAFCVRLLSVVLPRGPLDLALDALGADRASRRGTGLEYMENVLPSDLKARLLPFLESPAIMRYARREDESILADIAREEREKIHSLARLKERVRQLHVTPRN